MPHTNLFEGVHNSLVATHLVVELLAVIVCVMVVVTAWHTLNTVYARISNTMVFGFSVVAGCDLLHALTYAGMPFFLSESDTPKATLVWLTGRVVGVLNIDQSFVRDVELNTNDAAIVKTIISLAHTLDMKVVAEGVETAGQLEFLRNCGCKAFQGYFFSRPLCIQALSETLHARFTG